MTHGMFTKLIVAVVLFALVSARRPKWHELEGYSFEKYVQDFKKSYTGAEYQMRKKLFNAKLEEVRAHNTGNHLYKKGINHLSDLTDVEFKRMLGARPREMHHIARKIDAKPNNKQYQKKGVALPRSVDYRLTLPAVLTAVKDQGGCGSCWAHGSTEGVESHYAQKTGELYVLSQQQLTSCAPNPNDCGGNGGCGGSIIELAYDYLVSAGGQAQEWTYPYLSYDGNTTACRKSITPVVPITGYTKVTSNDQDAVMEAIATAGPLGINVAAMPWQTYETGVFTGCNYAQNITIDHVVQLVGYGHSDDLNVDYWIVRNSWSPGWGEDGYIRLLRTAQPECGWDVDPQQGTGCTGGPNQLWVCGMCGLLFDTIYPNMGN
jgi:cathepsin L